MSRADHATLTRPRSRWPAPRTPQRTMLLGGLAVVVGSVLPWLWTPLGTMWGTDGAGLWTLCAGCVAIAGSMVARPRLGAAHGAVSATVVLGVVAWQVATLLSLVGMAGWRPGVGLVIVAVGAGTIARSSAHAARGAVERA